MAVSSASFPNRELVVYALYLLGGTSKLVDTEDLAIKCFELFPSSFSWVKHPRYPDKDIVRVALTDARKTSNGGLVTGRAGQKRGGASTSARPSTEGGWILTPAGIQWIAEHQKSLELLVGIGEVKEHRQLLLKQLGRLKSHSLFVLYRDNPTGFSPSIGALADFLRCRVDAEPEVWQRRFDRLLRQAQAASQSEVSDFVTKCQEAYVRQR